MRRGQDYQDRQDTIVVATPDNPRYMSGNALSTARIEAEARIRATY